MKDRINRQLCGVVVCACLATTSAFAADFYVDPNYAGANGAPFNGYAGAYNNVAAALATSGGVAAGPSALSPNRIYFAPGTYNVGTSSLSYSRANVALIGLTGNPDDVVITSTLDAAYNPGTGALGTTGSSTLQLKGNNQSARGITFANSTNTPYIIAHGVAVSPSGSYVGNNAQTTNSPAVALLLQGDQQAFQNCKFMGYQDTLYTKGGRSYFGNCYVTGDNDFIFANGTTVFENSQINVGGDHSGGAITAASTDKRTSNGLVFLNSTITANSVRGNPVIDPQNAANPNGPNANSMYLGRPWGWQQPGGDASTVFVNTKMAAAIRALGWLAWNSNETNAANGKNGGDPSKDSRYAEFNSMDLSGTSLNTSGRVSWSHQLTADQVADFTVEQLFAFESAFPWFGLGYAGSSDPSSPNFSWPAYWGDRNTQNDNNSSLIGGNPTAYSNPSWTVASNWNPYAQLAVLPEPTTACTLLGALTAVCRRRR
jgi:pectinesterase